MAAAGEDEFKGESAGGDCETDLVLKARFFCRPIDVYKALTDADMVQRYTMSKANFDASVGGKFDFYDGSVLGAFVELEEPTKVVMKWKFKEWATGRFSTVTVKLTERGEGQTDVELTQTGIPTADAHGHGGIRARCEGGWRERILGGMKRFLGYGMEWQD